MTVSPPGAMRPAAVPSPEPSAFVFLPVASFLYALQLSCTVSYCNSPYGVSMWRSTAMDSRTQGREAG